MNRAGSSYFHLKDVASELEVPEATQAFEQSRYGDRRSPHPPISMMIRPPASRYSINPESGHSLMDAIDCVSAKYDDDDADDEDFDDGDTMADDGDDDSDESFISIEVEPADAESLRPRLNVDSLTQQPSIRPMTGLQQKGSYQQRGSANGHARGPLCTSQAIDVSTSTHSGSGTLSDRSFHPSSRGQLPRTGNPFEGLELLEQQERDRKFENAIQGLRSSSISIGSQTSFAESPSSLVSMHNSSHHRPASSTTAPRNIAGTIRRPQTSSSSTSNRNATRPNRGSTLSPVTPSRYPVANRTGSGRGNGQRWSHSIHDNARVNASSTATAAHNDSNHGRPDHGQRVQAKLVNGSNNPNTGGLRGTQRSHMSLTSMELTRSLHAATPHRDSGNDRQGNGHHGHPARDDTVSHQKAISASSGQPRIEAWAVPRDFFHERPSTVYRQPSREPRTASKRGLSASEHHPRGPWIAKPTPTSHAVVPEQVLQVLTHDHEHVSPEITAFRTPVTPPQPKEDINMDVFSGMTNAVTSASGEATTVEIFPGSFVPYLGVEHNREVLATGAFEVTACVACQIDMYCSNEGSFVHCPGCDSISPIVTTTKRPAGSQYVVLGFKG
jgi:hypothetical protein